MSGDCFETLLACAETTGVGFDPRLARRSIARAGREIPGAEAEVWLARLSLIGEDLGFRVGEGSGTLAQAIACASATRPVMVFAPGGPSGRGWTMLADPRGGRVLVTRGVPGEKARRLAGAKLARLLGLDDPNRPIEWGVLEPALACGEAAEGGEVGDHGNHEGGHGHADRSPLSRLMGLIRPEGPDIRTVVAFAAGVGVLSLATPLAIEALVSTVAMSLMVQQLVVLSLVLLGCLGLAAAIRAMQTYVVEIIQQRLFVRVAADLAYRLPRVRVDAYDREHGPELVNRFFDVLTVQKVASLLLLDGIAIILQTLIGLTVLAFYHPYLLGFDLIMVGSLIVMVFLLGRGAVASSIIESRTKYAMAAQLQELARVPAAYKLDGGKTLALDRADAFARRYIGARKAHFRILFRQIVFALGFQAIASAALLGLGGWLVIEGQLTLGQLVAAELIVATVAGSFTKLGKHLEAWYDLMAAVNKLGHLFDLPLERVDGEGYETPPDRRGASVGIGHLHYSFGHGREALRGLDLEIKAGERVAILGAGGAGKSTLADLLFGLRTPEHGHIEIDGVNIRDLHLTSLRKTVALVKGAEIIVDSIIENVRLGRPDLGTGDVRRALEAVGLWEELSALPDGLQTQLTPRGGPLSSGQARRLMLARAIAGRPRLLVVDGTLDGLDADTLVVAARSLFAKSAPWTLILITNDDDLARICDRAMVMTSGRLGSPFKPESAADLETLMEESRPCQPA